MHLHNIYNLSVYPVYGPTAVRFQLTQLTQLTQLFFLDGRFQAVLATDLRLGLVGIPHGWIVAVKSSNHSELVGRKSENVVAIQADRQMPRSA